MMKEIGNDIKEIREKKGISQDRLASLSGLNLRTIQRIEKNETKPHGKTLQLLCEALDVNIEEFMKEGKIVDKNFLIIFHLSVLVFMIIPLGNIISPLILWIYKRDKIIGLYETGVNLLNFQLLWSIIAFILFVSSLLLKILHLPYSSSFLTAFMILYFLNILLSIISALRIKNSKNTQFYPKVLGVFS
ncbi:MAG: helix-turn-helix domain-containing protein [Flavobacteriales bacterium]|nr:helix-turn-helix domain-containing protein [Flavobacteriales bacterium]